MGENNIQNLVNEHHVKDKKRPSNSPYFDGLMVLIGLFVVLIFLAKLLLGQS